MARIPMGRVDRREDLVGPVIFLASDMSRYVTGITLPSTAASSQSDRRSLHSHLSHTRNRSMTQAKKFASQADLEEKKVTFSQISEHAWAYTAEGDPNTGIIIGDDAVLVADTQATPAMAADVIRRIREVTDKPIKYVVLTHYHAVRVLGASAYRRSRSSPARTPTT